MSTNTPEKDLEALSSLLCVRDNDGRSLLMIGLFATLYFREPWDIRVRAAVTDVVDGYLAEFKGQLAWIQEFDSDNPQIYRLDENRVPLPRQWLPSYPEGAQWELGIHGGQGPRDVAEYQIEAFGAERRGGDELGYLKLHYPLRWLVDHPGDIQRRLREMAQKLRPFHGYSGVGFLEPVSIMAQLRTQEILTPLAPRFPGIEVDAPVMHARKCKSSIKGINWLTVLSDHFVDAVGGAAYLRVRLDEPNFPFYKYDGGLIIQAGPHPEVGDTLKDRWPRHYVTLSKVLEKIRVKDHGGFHLGGGARMNRAACAAWLNRFDGK